MKAAKAFFRSAKTVAGVTPDRVTTDGHDSYPRAIRTELGKAVRHRTNRYLNNRLEQNHRGLEGRYWPMLGFSSQSAARFCRAYDELRNDLRPRTRRNQHVPAFRRRMLFLQRTLMVPASWKRPDRPCRALEGTGYTCWREFRQNPGQYDAAA